MAHELSVVEENGQRIVEAMYAKRPAWHELGKVLPFVPTSEEAIKAAHLEWMMEACPLFVGVDDDVEEVESHVLLRRSDNGAHLAVVSKDYGIVQNVEAFGLLDELAKDGIVRYESAFAMKGGRIVCLLARLPGIQEVQEGDNLLRYVMLLTSHDGTRSLTILPTSVRVVCANTVRLALSKDGAGSVKLRHDSNVHENAKLAIKVLASLNNAFDGSLELFRSMAKRAITIEEQRRVFDEVLPLPDKREQPRAFNSMLLARTKIQTIANKEARGKAMTSWNLLNGFTDYVDHHMSIKASNDRRAESNAFSRLMGSGHEIKDAALRTLTATLS